MSKAFHELIQRIDSSNIYVIDASISKQKYCPLDLSISNEALKSVDLRSSDDLASYVDTVIQINEAQVAFGGYLEKRNIYQRSTYFNEPSHPQDERNIHLGVDLWTKAGTTVLAVLDGKIHSFQNNSNFGDYGPTIIIEHELSNFTFYSLYGHLSTSTLQDLEVGREVKQGEVISTLGIPSENGDYPPHLHFQIILDLQGKTGDYPGVCSANELEFYQKNCPDPINLLGL